MPLRIAHTYIASDFESLAGLVFVYLLGQLVSARARMRLEAKTLGTRMPVFRDAPYLSKWP